MAWRPSDKGVGPTQCLETGFPTQLCPTDSFLRGLGGCRNSAECTRHGLLICPLTRRHGFALCGFMDRRSFSSQFTASPPHSWVPWGPRIQLTTERRVLLIRSWESVGGEGRLNALFCPFYIRASSIGGVGYPQGSWNQSPANTEGQFKVLGKLELYSDFQ